MAYSKVSLLCVLLPVLLISSGVSARWLDNLSGFARINMDDLVEEHNENSKRKDAGNGNSAAAAAQLPSGKSILVGLAPAPAPAYHISETAKTDEGFHEETFSSTWVDANDIDEDDADANTGSDPEFEPNGTDDEGTEDDDDIPLP